MPRSAGSERFTGFPPDGIDFYRRLSADNTKAFWVDNVEVFDTAIRTPMTSLTDELEAEFGTFHIFRPHRDVRFSRDKSPYKTSHGAATEGEGGEVYYLQLDEDGLFVATGYHRMAKDQLDRYRRAVIDDTAGPELEQIVASLERRYEIGGRALSTAPRGYPRDHERVRLLQYKGMTAGRRLGAGAWLATRQAKRRIVDTWRGAAPLDEWLNAHVGPSTIPPDELS